MPTDTLQSPPNDQRHGNAVVPIVPDEGPTTEAGSGGPMRDPDGWGLSTTISPQHIDVTAEETCPAPAVHDEAPQRTPVTQSAPVPSAKSLELMSQLEALARDVAANSGHDSSDQRIEAVQGDSEPQTVEAPIEPSIRVSPRDQFAGDRPSVGRRRFLTVASFLMAALVGVGATLAWQSHRFSAAKSPNNVGVAAEQSGFTPAGQVSAPGAAPQEMPVAQSTSAPSATSLGLVQQLDAMARDLAAVRHGIEQLAAKQEQLEQLAARQDQLKQLTAKQDQMAQNIAKLQAIEQSNRYKTSLPQAVPIPQRKNAPTIVPPPPPEAAAQLSSAPRPTPLRPVPPLPVPP